MNRFVYSSLVVGLVFVSVSRVRGDDEAVKAVLNRAVKALGGEEKLAKADACLRKSKGTIALNDNQITVEATVQGLDRYRAEFQVEFNGNTVKGVTVVNGDKGWQKFRDNIMELDAIALANEKRSIYLQVVAARVTPLTGPGFKLGAIAEEKVGDKPAVVVKVTGPDGKDFSIAFDKASGLPVKVVAAKMIGFQGQEYTQETTYSDYKVIDGIKRAMKVESKRDGQIFIKQEVSEYKVLDKVDPQTFNKPE